jgi:hypothetical protein
MYSDSKISTYRILAATLSAAAILDRIKGPAGAVGRLIDLQVLVTTTTTTNPNTIDVGLLGDVAAYGTHTTPVTVADLGANGIVRGATEKIPADSVIEISTNGECVAGVGDITVMIDWNHPG